MSHNNPDILALDFDGVICDGLIEYFQTAWLSYHQVWSYHDIIPNDVLKTTFYRLRPVVEVGWEMPVIIRALILGIPEEEIWSNWVNLAQEIIAQDHLKSADIGKIVDTIRDEWIARDLDDWLSQHRFYPGVIDKLKTLVNSNNAIPYIVTTKEGRFVQKLLQQQGVNLSEDLIFGKENKRPKYEILRTLTGTDKKSIWFVEDRLKTLQSVTVQSDLNHVKLYLADWGYNTQFTRDSIKDDPRIKLLSLEQFAGNFSLWNQKF
jgi:phosphoglycolate phosphatase-like HAD superfamily hydrolase